MKIRAPFRIRKCDEFLPPGEVAFEVGSWISPMSEATVERMFEERGFDAFESPYFGGVIVINRTGAVYHEFGGFSHKNPAQFVRWGAA